MYKKFAKFFIFTYLLLTACGLGVNLNGSNNNANTADNSPVEVLPTDTPDDWILFTSPDGSFTVEMPGIAEESIEEIPTELGTLLGYFYILDLGDEAYLVNYTDFPADVVAANDPYDLLQGAKEGAMGTTYTLVSEESFEFQGHPALHVVLKATESDLGIRAYYIMQDNRLFQAFVLGDAVNISAPEYDRFFDTFTFVE